MRKVFFPSSIGLSLCTKTLEITATWGDSTHDAVKGEEANEEQGTCQSRSSSRSSVQKGLLLRLPGT